VDRRRGPSVNGICGIRKTDSVEGNSPISPTVRTSSPSAQAAAVRMTMHTRGDGTAVVIRGRGTVTQTADGPRAGRYRRGMKPISYARQRFPPEVVRHVVWLYLRFTLSYRDVEELLAERGLDVSFETVRRWVAKFGPAFARNLRRLRPRTSDTWHLDEMVVAIRGRRMYLWRAVNSKGEVLDLLVQPRRDKAAALKLLRKLLKKQGCAPRALVTDKLRSYGAAKRDLGLAARREQPGRELASAGPTTRTEDAGPGSAQRFLS